LTTEQIIILGFLALAFFAGWVARALVGSARDETREWQEKARAAKAAGEEAPPYQAREYLTQDTFYGLHHAHRGGERGIAVSGGERRAAASRGERGAPAGGVERSASAAAAAATTPAAGVEPVPVPAARSFAVAVHQSRDELGRAIRAYHAAVVRTLRNGSDRDSGQGTLEALSGALVALSRAVEHESRALEAEHPLTERLQRTGVELRRLADDVMRHSRGPELPAGIFDQLEQHLISAASMILTQNRLQAETT
jgi:hypothetical protein